MPRPKTTLRQLSYFVALADTVSFTRATEQMGVLQPSLSQQICALEAIIGAPLFERGAQAILTPLGRDLLDRDYELTQIKVAEADAKLAESRAKLTRIDIQLNRQSAQLVRAPRDGRVQQLNASGSAIVSPGTVLAVIAPERVERAVELYIDGRDVPLIRPGRPVRLEFEGWPAIQFSGWPSVAHGMFDGRVRAIDPNAAPDGLFRILVEPMPGKPAWPAQEFARQGGKVRDWVQGETVKVGYELWRQLNNFPLEFGRRPAATTQEDSKAKPATPKAEDEATGKK
ncbi:LysR family transcriptional regulator [Xanthomonas oryzae]|uniref:LysR family transcriptional regulator n=1 Tax=Xanthomonas oryzae TaxID=347 RepID=UPI000428E742|nr:LysR family transcriptional regulator [Xanthomonas oryzae]AUI91047.1 RND transporter [Xanthomonas oryzae pv. oryzae]AUI94718.1 RND transporter [Xanthomonas oryzae pv. oryzae]AUI98389.1 RND transporter [Xanthomonas oryzae pv. oryzae]AUJ02065.1 RND transporter [Xanthomonas oryzae pv. oryzae]AUJ05737.1 RND transporter [Xanthomonas oryzae pv. oryzae]